MLSVKQLPLLTGIAGCVIGTMVWLSSFWIPICIFASAVLSVIVWSILRHLVNI